MNCSPLEFLGVLDLVPYGARQTVTRLVPGEDVVVALAVVEVMLEIGKLVDVLDATRDAVVEYAPASAGLRVDAYSSLVTRVVDTRVQVLAYGHATVLSGQIGFHGCGICQASMTARV